MQIKPLADRVVTKPVEAEEKTKSGIILTAAAQEKPQMAEVVAVGPGGVVDGNEVKMYVKVGDRVNVGDVVCIVEAMKVMNEIKSDKAGVIKEVLAKDGSMVEYDAPLFVIGD